MTLIKIQIVLKQMIQFNVVHWIYNGDEAESSFSGVVDQVVSPSIFRKRTVTNNIPVLMRRRFSQSIKHAFGAIDSHYFNEIPFIYATQNGEMQITLELIKQFHDELSPTQFSLSVHNAGAGLISIVQKSRQNYTVIDSMSGAIEHALLEAYSQLNQFDRVGVIYFENHLPVEFKSLTTHVNLNGALVLILEKGDDYQLSCQSTPTSTPKDKSREDYIMPTNFAENIAYFLDDESRQIFRARHGHLQWCWEKKCVKK